MYLFTFHYWIQTSESSWYFPSLLLFYFFQIICLNFILFVAKNPLDFLPPSSSRKDPEQTPAPPPLTAGMSASRVTPYFTAWCKIPSGLQTLVLCNAFNHAVRTPRTNGNDELLNVCVQFSVLHSVACWNIKCLCFLRFHPEPDLAGHWTLLHQPAFFPSSNIYSDTPTLPHCPTFTKSSIQIFTVHFSPLFLLVL